MCFAMLQILCVQLLYYIHTNDFIKCNMLQIFNFEHVERKNKAITCIMEFESIVQPLIIVRRGVKNSNLRINSIFWNNCNFTDFFVYEDNQLSFLECSNPM